VQLALKTYSGAFVGIGQNEARIYRLLEKDASILGFLGDFKEDAGMDTHETDGPKTRTFNILLEWADRDLEGDFALRSPPILQQQIAEYWRSLSSVATALNILHNSNAVKYDIESDNSFVEHIGWVVQ
jgi:hypothetical protein